MQFLNAVVIMIIPFFLTSMIAADPSTRKCVANSKILSSVPGEFTLTALDNDDQGRLDLTASRLVGLEVYSIFWGEDVDVLQLQPRNRTIFSLTNKTLIAGDFKAQFLGESSNPGGRYGIQVFGFNATPFLEPWPARFTATKACDSYGRRFLRLGGPDGKDSFGIERERPNSSIYFRPFWYIPTLSVQNVTLVVKPVPPTKISFDGDDDDVIFT